MLSRVVEGAVEALVLDVEHVLVAEEFEMTARGARCSNQTTPFQTIRLMRCGSLTAAGPSAR
jgi:hypothetical protein